MTRLAKQSGFFALVVVILSSVAQAGPAEDLAKARVQFNAHMAAGRLKEAEPIGRQMLALAEKSLAQQPLEIAACANDLATVYWRQGDFAKAEPLFKRSPAERS